MGSVYELQAGRIEQVFGAYRVAARVWQATVTPRFVRYDVTTALGTRLSAAEGLGEELAMALGVKAVRVYRSGGTIRVEVPRPAPREIRLVQLLPRIKPMPPFCATLGVDESGNPLLLRIDSPDVAHVLVAGTTGSGKTVLLRTMLLSLVLSNRPGFLQVVLLDPTGRGLNVLAGVPHRWYGLDVVTEAADVALVLSCLIAEMERRDRARITVPHLVVAVDELADLIQTSGGVVVDALTRLVQRGRAVGIHVVAATQRPSAALVGGLLKANFPVRLVGTVVSAEDARVAAGRGGTEAERLLGRGDFVLVVRGEVIRFQAAYADEVELRRLVALAAEPERRTRHWAGGALAGDAVVTASAGARRGLRDRYTADQLLGFIEAAGGNLSEAARAAFGYKDAVTLGIMREVAGRVP